MPVQTLEAPKRDTSVKRRYDISNLWITLPQRDTPGTFPPYGIMSVMTYLKKFGYNNMELYNMDLDRPTRQEAIDRIALSNPEILLISAPASTCYENAKYYAAEVRKRLPNVYIILGGALAASAEIICKMTEVDMCILGEGEYACLEVFDQLAEDFGNRNFRHIKGLGYLNSAGTFINTGYPDQMPKDEMYEVDWELLGEKGIKHCMPNFSEFANNSYAYKYWFPEGLEDADPKILNSNVGTLSLSKGCVARCTFCHRFIKGIRFIPPEICVERIKELRDKYNCGVFSFGDECFGADQKWLKEFCRQIKPLNVRWTAAGMRVQNMSPEIIAMMKDAGCGSIVYGMETGSDRILQIMEKRASLQDNVNAFKWTLDAGLYTIPQLILGMPGENRETIEESAEFISHFLTLHKDQNPMELSINFAQALPGTPLYEYARHKGLIGPTMEEEEEYLLLVSDRNASDAETTLDLTGYPRLILLSWRDLVRITTCHRYVEKFGYDHYLKHVLGEDKKPSFWKLLFGIKFNRMVFVYPKFVYKTRGLLWFYSFVDILVRRRQPKRAFSQLWEVIRFYAKGGPKSIEQIETKSLRRIVEKDMGGPYKSSPEMVELRKGR